jgi:hypothetical protein
MSKSKTAKIDPGAPGTALEQLGDVDPAAAAEALGIEPEPAAPKGARKAKAKKAGPAKAEAEAPAKAPAPAANGSAKATAGLTKRDQVVLAALAEIGGPATRKQVVDITGLRPESVGGCAGYFNAEVNGREVHSGNLSRRGYVKLDAEKRTYAITAAGKKALAKASAEAEAASEKASK